MPCHAPADANVLASNLAAVIASYMKTCGVLDFHFRGGDLAILLKLTPRHTIMDLLSQTETIDEVMFRQALTVHDIGIELLAGPPAACRHEGSRRAGVSTDYRIGTRRWPVVVINSEDLHHAEQIRAIATSDDVLLTMRLDVASLHRTQKHIEFFMRSHLCSNGCTSSRWQPDMRASFHYLESKRY